MTTANEVTPRYRLRQRLIEVDAERARLQAEVDHYKAELDRYKRWLTETRQTVAAMRPENVEDLTQPDDGNHEACRLCDRGYMLWHAPDPLWLLLNGRYGGTMCPRCFDTLARRAGIDLRWTPIVWRRDGVPTTNWWDDPIRDRLLVGEPDPGYHDGSRANVPQGHWGTIARALDWPYKTPYPDENRFDRMTGVVYKDSGVNAEAAAARGEGADG